MTAAWFTHSSASTRGTTFSVTRSPGRAGRASSSKRSSVRLRIGLEDVKPDRAFVVYGGDERYPLPGGVEAVGLGEMVEELLGQVG